MSSNPKSILVLERDDDVAGIICMMLDMQGHRATVVKKPAEALTLLSQHLYDVVLTSQVTGTYELGLGVPSIIRAVQPGTAIIVTTQWYGELDLLAPVNAVLPKPFTLAQLEATLERVSRASL